MLSTLALKSVMVCIFKGVRSIVKALNLRVSHAQTLSRQLNLTQLIDPFVQRWLLWQAHIAELAQLRGIYQLICGELFLFQ